MQRIDENTYVDDTLVTCAEYQLFIDEMREQGKYYQPDQWTSYQFSEGHAMEPILGVRHSDAIEFCEWLTSRDGEAWKFRLPDQKEADAFPMKSREKSPLGYWFDGNDHFMWIGSTPEDEINRKGTLALKRTLAVAVNFARFRDRDFNNTINFGYALNLDRTRDRANTLDNAFELKHNLALALDRDGDRANALRLALELAHKLADDFDLAIDIYIDLLTLQERIAGRSPAFEGIRLVKERVR